MEQDFDYQIVLHNLSGPPTEVSYYRLHVVLDTAWDYLSQPNPFISADIEFYDKLAWSKEDDPQPVKVVPYWDEINGLRFDSWCSTLQEYVVAYAEVRLIKKLPAPRPNPLPRFPEQALLWPEIERYIPESREQKRFRKTWARVPYVRRLEDIPGDPEVLAELLS